MQSSSVLRVRCWGGVDGVEVGVPMKSAVELARRTFPLGLLCGALVVGTACPQGSGDRLDEIRGLHSRNRYEESLEGLRALMDEDPTDPEVNYLFAKALMQIGEPSLAIWPLRRVVELPDYAFEAGMMLAWATLDSRMPQDAVDAALATEPDNVEALALRAHANLKAGHYADALTDTERAFELDPDNPAILVPRVLALLEFNRVDEAEAALDASKLVVESGEEQVLEKTQARLCLTNAGFALDNGDQKNAEVMFADCLDAYPADPLVVLAVVDFYDSTDEQERATDLLRRTFEDTRSTEFGHALLQRARRLGNEERHNSPPTATPEKLAGGSCPGSFV
jgi:predicted Zn-dependent protease